MSIIKNPIDQYFDLDGSPLSAGYLYFGAVNGNPETSPIGVYWDNLLTIPAAQPIRTVNGYPSRLGSPASIYTGTDVSITVKNKKGSLVFYQPTSSLTNAAQNIITRTSNTILTANEIGKTILATGTFTQTFDASVALGSGWSVTYANVGSGVITLDPNLTELIDGVSTKTIPAGRSLIIYCDGIGLTTTLFAAPFIDSTPLLKGSVDSTKQVAFEVDGVTTGTTRTVTVPDANGTMAYVDSQIFTGTPTLPTGTIATTQSGRDNSTKLATTAYVDRRFTSSAQTITPAGLLTLAHGLGAKPYRIMATAICTTADAGYSIGDEVVITTGAIGTAGGNYGLAVYFDATNVYVRFSNTNPPLILDNKTTGAIANLTSANWQLYVRAEL